MMAIRSTLLRALVFGLLMAANALSSHAQTYPNRVVKFIVPNPPGNVGDSVARMVAEQLGRNWKQSVIVENRSGANSMIGVEAALRAPADGYTLLFSPGGNITAASALIPNLSFKPEAELVAVHRGVRVPVWMVVATGSPYKSLRDVVEAAKRHPASLISGAAAGNRTAPFRAGRFSAQCRHRTWLGRLQGRGRRAARGGGRPARFRGSRDCAGEAADRQRSPARDRDDGKPAQRRRSGYSDLRRSRLFR